MSGSSLDGLDIACIDINSDVSYQIVACETIPLPIDLVERLRIAAHLSIKEYMLLESHYTNYLADSITRFISGNDLHYIDIVSVHGHTVLHHPEQGYSLQMINGGKLASMTSQNILVDFRNQDIGKGGQGAPLAPIVERLFPSYHAFCNLGGIANISFHNGQNIKAFDIGPCNQMLNYFANQIGMKYDKDGLSGRLGLMDKELIEIWMSDSYFTQTGSKSIDNEWLKDTFLYKTYDSNPTDLLATSYEFISETIAIAINKELNEGDHVMFTGGGTYNKYLMQLIQDKVKPIGIHIPDSTIIDYKESLLMAYLGYLYLNEKPSTLPSSTNSSVAVMAGALYIGK